MEIELGIDANIYARFGELHTEYSNVGGTHLVFF
jgi:hypothetical protein